MTDADLKRLENKLDAIDRNQKTIIDLLRDLRPKKAKEVALKNNILRVIAEKNMKGACQ